MRPAIKDLLQLSDDRLFEEVATGIRYIIEHAERLESIAVRLIAIGEHRGAAIVRALDPPERTGEGQHSLATGPFSGSGASQSPQNQRESSWNSLARRRER